MSNPIPKHRYLQSLSNIDIAQRTKKVITTPTRPAATKIAQKPKRAPAKDMPIAVLFSQPIVVGTPVPVISPIKPRVRRIYDRDFLLKFKYASSEFPAGVQTPEDIIAQYNKDFEVCRCSSYALYSFISSFNAFSTSKLWSWFYRACNMLMIHVLMKVGY